MSSRIPVLTSREIIRRLTKAGFKIVRQRGSHVRMEHISDRRMITIPVHFKKDIPKGTLRAIIKQAGLTIEEFQKL